MIEEMDCRQGFEVCHLMYFKDTPPVIFRHTHITPQEAKEWASPGQSQWIEESYKRARRKDELR